MNVTRGLDFILQHFQEPIWPRRISTYKTENKQFEVNSKDEALRHFKESDYLDCRISAFGRNEIENEWPNLIFVDLDNISALNEVRALFYKTIKAVPTVLHTGNGLAIIQPIDIISLKGAAHDETRIEEPAKIFLSFAERYLTNSKCDTGNHPSLKSCLIRIPGSFNSKERKYKQVKIIQEWDKHSVNIRNLPFKAHLDKIIREQKKRQNKPSNVKHGEIPYIEHLLKRKINDCRKRTFALILSPYLVNVKQLSIEQAEQIIYDYFDGYIPKPLINYKLNEVLKKGVLPYSLSKMQEQDRELHQIVTNQTINEVQN